MLRAIVALAAVAVLAACAWLYLQGNDRGSAIAPAREIERDATARADAALENLPNATERATAAESQPVIAIPQSPLAADHELSTGVLAGRLEIGGEPLVEAIELVLVPADDEALEATRGTLRTDTLGRFRREGLPADWSGALMLPAPYLVEVTDPGWNQRIAVPALRENLVIEVERAAAVRIRMLRDDGSPAEHVAVSVEQHEANGWGDDMARTDGQGRVCMRRAAKQPHTIVVRARHEDGSSVTARFGDGRLVASEPFGDLDLGDLVLVTGREVELRCMAADGTPVVTSRADVRIADDLVRRTTDEDGVVRIGLPLAPVDLEVEIVGFLRAAARVLPAQDRIDVVLRRANLLRVEVTDAHDRPWVNGRLSVLAARHPFGEQRRVPVGFRGGIRAELRTRGQADVDIALELGLDADGAVEIPGIETGLELELLVRDELGHVALRDRQPGIADEERRVVHLQLSREPCELEVRVLDAAGRPLPNAEVKLTGESAGISSSTGADGATRFENLFAPRLDLSATAQGLQEARIGNVDPCARPVTVALIEGRTLAVELRDEAGRSVDAGRLELHDLSGERSFPSEGPCRFGSLPFEPLELVWTFCGAERRLPIDAAQVSVQLVVPTLGEVQVAVEGWIPVERESLYLRVESAEGTGPGCSPLWLSAGRQPLQVLPGRYRLSAWVLRVDRDHGPQELPLGDSREISVDPGSTQEVVLGP